MAADLTVLKLGGALLTDKRVPDSLRAEVLAQVAAEIAAALAEGLLGRLLLVHGVGSFGHPPVLKYRLHKGFQSPQQLIQLTETQQNVMRLRLMIVAAFQAAGVPVCLMLPSSCMTASGFRHQETYYTAVSGFLRLGMVPLLGGDVLPDDQNGFTVYGGDGIAVDMARHFGATRLIFATEVDGVHDRDPQQEPQAQRRPFLSLSQMSVQTEAHPQVDASGAMAGKLRAMAQAEAEIAAGMETWLISMMQYGRFLALLRGADPGGTRLLP